MHFKTIDTTALVILGTVIMLIMLFTIILFVSNHQRRIIKWQLKLQELKLDQQTKLITAAIQSQEAERKRISAELHDGVGALLSTIKLYLNQLQPVRLNNKDEVSIINECKDLIEETVRTVRNISVNLQPAIIKDFGLEAALTVFSEKISQSDTLRSSVISEGIISRFNVEKELAVFRIIQELTNNVLKHAQAQYINYTLINNKEETLNIFIEHSGNGLSQEMFEEKLYSKEGLGLKNIQNRLNFLKGVISFKKNDDNINNISLRIPLNT